MDKGIPEVCKAAYSVNVQKIGIVEKTDYKGEKDEEHYMFLNCFEKLARTRADKLILIIREAAGDDYKIQWNPDNDSSRVSLWVKSVVV